MLMGLSKFRLLVPLVAEIRKPYFRLVALPRESEDPVHAAVFGECDPGMTCRIVYYVGILVI